MIRLKEDEITATISSLMNRIERLEEKADRRDWNEFCLEGLRVAMERVQERLNAMESQLGTTEKAVARLEKAVDKPLDPGEVLRCKHASPAFRCQLREGHFGPCSYVPRYDS